MSDRCTNCGIDYHQMHRSDKFPTVILCPPCVQSWFGWMHQNQVIDGNPLVAEFWFAPLWTRIKHPTRGSELNVVRGFKIVLET